MKTISAIFASALLSISAFAGTQTNLVAWAWTANPSDMGGLSITDYYTNITFTLWSSTNVSIPMTNWPAVTNWQASSFPSPDGTNWTNAVVTDGQTRFFLLTVGAASGQSPFSNLLPLVAVPPSGVMKSIRPH